MQTRVGATTSEYVSWTEMKRRCLNPAHPYYADYGGRGIKVCDEWLNSFEAFLRDMGRKPSPDLTLERGETDGDYEPGNCRWATQAEQNRNKRDNVRLTIHGRTKTLAEWCALMGCNYTTVRHRLQRGWGVKAAFCRTSG